MTTIYIDGSAAVQPGAIDRLAHLVEAGHELVLIAPAGHDAGGALAWAGQLVRLPDLAPRGSWFVTADRATCRDRQLGLQTMLVGPRDDGPRRSTRCDTTARDLRDAVLEILAADAMP